MGRPVSQLAYFENEQLSDERRGSPRKKLRLNASGAGTPGDQTQVVVHDISETGLLLETSLMLAQGEQLDVIMPDTGARRVTVVWASGHYFGCEFAEPIAPAGASTVIRRGIDGLPKKGSPEAVSLAAFQLHQLSMAIARISSVLDRAIDQLSKHQMN